MVFEKQSGRVVCWPSPSFVVLALSTWDSIVIRFAYKSEGALLTVPGEEGRGAARFTSKEQGPRLVAGPTRKRQALLPTRCCAKKKQPALLTLEERRSDGCLGADTGF